MRQMFSGAKIGNLNLSNLNTTNVTNMSNMFGNATVDGPINFSSFQTSKLEDAGQMFVRFKTSSLLDLTPFNFNNTMDFEHMFSEAVLSGGLKMPKFKVTTKQLKSNAPRDGEIMRYMFNAATISGTLDLTMVDVSSFKGSNGIFGSAKIDALNISNWNTSSFTIMYAMFYNSEIEEINISSFSSASLIDAENLFLDSKVSKIILGENFKLENITQGDYMFGRTVNLKSLDLSNINMTRLNSVGILSPRFLTDSGITELTMKASDYNNATVKSYLIDDLPNKNTINVIRK